MTSDRPPKIQRIDNGMLVENGVFCQEIVEEIKMPWIDDFHIHLRQGEMMERVTPLIKGGGTKRCFVMPNLTPPITTAKMAANYKAELESLAPGVEFRMALYLVPQLTPEEVELAFNTAGVTGVKSYPRGVTTNSDVGVESYEPYYPIFAKMEQLGMTLHLHGEVPLVSVMKAEEMFLHKLEELHKAFPRLKIVLEHCSTEAAVECVKKLGPTVGATITAHHLDITIDDVVGCCHLFCKPVAKLPSDRTALQEVIRQKNKKFFLGSDSAPHPRDAKEAFKAAAGVYTSSHLLVYLADTFARLQMTDCLEDFCCRYGAEFFGIPVNVKDKPLTLKRANVKVPEFVGSVENPAKMLRPFRFGQEIGFVLEGTDQPIPN